MSVSISKCTCDADTLCATHWATIVKFSKDEAASLYSPRVELNYGYREFSFSPVLFAPHTWE